MDETQTQQQNSNSPVQDTQTGANLTKEEVQNAVESALANVKLANETQMDGLAESVAALDTKLQTIADNTTKDDTQSPADTVYTIRLDSGQVATAKVAARIACTEGLLLVILLAVSCGLQLFRILTERWH